MGQKKTQKTEKQENRKNRRRKAAKIRLRNLRSHILSDCRLQITGCGLQRTFPRDFIWRGSDCNLTAQKTRYVYDIYVRTAICLLKLIASTSDWRLCQSFQWVWEAANGLHRYYCKQYRDFTTFDPITVSEEISMLCTSFAVYCFRQQLGAPASKIRFDFSFG